MSTEQWIALSAACVAVVALTATVLLGVALRRTRADVRALATRPGEDPADIAPDSPASAAPESTVPTAQPPARQELVEVTPTTPLPQHPHGGDEPQIVTREGRVVVVPSTEQVVEATMGKPMIRGAVLGHGIRHALRPESRDRLRGMIRREYRRRRRIRLRAGRRAARAANIPPRDTQSWLGTPVRNRLNVDDDGGS